MTHRMRAGLHGRRLCRSVEQALSLGRSVRTQIRVAGLVTYRSDHMGTAGGFCSGLPLAAFETAIKSECGPAFRKFAAAAALGHLSRSAGVNRAFDDPFYFIDTDPIELGYLRARHSIAGQRADAARLSGGHSGTVTIARRRPPYQLVRCGGIRLGIGRYPRRDRKDTGLTPGLLLSGRCGSGRCGSGRCGRQIRSCRSLRRLKEVLSCLASSVDLITIIAIVSCLPFGHRMLLQRNMAWNATWI
jgi:hypothetical protein